MAEPVDCCAYTEPFMETSEIILCVFMAAFTLTAAVIDVRSKRLPNWLTVSAGVMALIFHTVTGGLSGLGGSLLGFAVGFSILFVLWLIGGGGGGDVKLMGAVGAWLGWRMTLAVFLISTIFAVLGSVLVMAGSAMTYGVEGTRRKFWMRGAKPKNRELTDEERMERLKKRRLMPYALPVALSVWLTLAYQFILKPQ